MSECLMLIASAKIPAGKRCDFSWPKIGLLAHPTIPHPPTIQTPPKNKN